MMKGLLIAGILLLNLIVEIQSYKGRHVRNNGELSLRNHERRKQQIKQQQQQQSQQQLQHQEDNHSEFVKGKSKIKIVHTIFQINAIIFMAFCFLTFICKYRNKTTVYKYI